MSAKGALDAAQRRARRVARRLLGPKRGRWSDDAKTIGMHEAYQVKLADSLPERTRLIENALGPTSRSVLDVGCNLGDITVYCAQSGRFAVGIDQSETLIRRARSQHAGIDGCAFAVMELTPQRVVDLPTFDAVLVLSVHHHWLGTHGPEIAGQMLRDLAEKTNHVMVFESASRRVRYGDYPPDFVDNDEDSVTSYLNSYLHEHVGDLFDRIDPMGKTPCVGEREPYRWSFALYR